MRYRVLPYRQGSRSAKTLSVALGGKVLKLENSKFKLRPGETTIVNWGRTDYGSVGSLQAPEGAIVNFLNSPDKIKNASNKLNFFRMMRGVGYGDIIPAFWETSDEIPEAAYPIVCRTTLAGHSGDGIVIAEYPDDLVDAPLYVAYIKKQDEYRIHVGKKNNVPEVISLQRKARRIDVPAESVNWRIRNHSNGFVFVREGVSPPQAVIDAALKSLECTGLDFGAVDVIYNNYQERGYVLEINTAPGLEGQTVEDYATFFRSLG